MIIGLCSIRSPANRDGYVAFIGQRTQEQYKQFAKLDALTLMQMNGKTYAVALNISCRAPLYEHGNNLVRARVADLENITEGTLHTTATMNKNTKKRSMQKAGGYQQKSISEARVIQALRAFPVTRPSSESGMTI